VRSGFSELILPGASVWAHAPEKVLGMRRHWAEENQDLQGAVMRAVYRACLWLGKADNRPLASDILARSQHLDLPDHAIDPALTGHIIPKEGQKPWSVPHFLKFFSEATTFPWRSHGAWIGTQLSRHYGLDVEHSIRIGADCMRPDLYRQHLGRGGVDMPGASMKVEGVLNKPTPVASTQGEMILGPDAFFDGKTFDFGLI
jgi:NitT/TauT family transport system ATP-binding protein